jgi:hypothetical protein
MSIEEVSLGERSRTECVRVIITNVPAMRNGLERHPHLRVRLPNLEAARFRGKGELCWGRITHQRHPWLSFPISKIEN